MTPRRVIHFFRTPLGAFLAFLLLMVLAFVVESGFRKSAPSKEPVRGNLEFPKKGQTIETITRQMVPYAPPKELPTPPAASVPPSKKQEKTSVLPPLTLYAETKDANESALEPLGTDYAPYGRLIQCELVITVDSSSINTPIVGLVTDDVYHNGRLIIPAGTEVHGNAKVDRVRERIASSGPWTLVWQSGEELSVSGLALDREKEPNESGWSITDGSAGLRGQLLKSDDLAEIKLFAATFLSGAASGLTEREQTLFGSRAVPSLRNAPLAGANEVLNTYARQILDTIQRDGFYVRVPAGKQFYVYVTQTIDRSRAVIGGTRLSKVKPEERSTGFNDPMDRLRQNIERIYPSAPSADFPDRQPFSRP